MTNESSSSSKMSPFWSGLKDGSKKKAIDKLVSNFSDPIADLILDQLVVKFPNLNISTPIVRAMVQCAAILLLSEAVGIVMPLASKNMTSSKKERLESVEAYLRNFAGQKAGEEMMDLACSVLPAVLEHLADAITSPDEVGSLSESNETYLPPLLIEEVRS